jgi:hypothetical protein
MARTCGHTDREYERLVEAFYVAALYLKQRVEQDGWRWSSNYLREHVRCATKLHFTNSLSPEILREVVRRHPDMASWIEIGPRKVA